MVLSFNECVKYSLLNGFNDAVMKTDFVSDIYKTHLELNEDIYVSIILDKKTNIYKKNLCTMYNRAKIYYNKDFKNNKNKYCEIPNSSNDNIVFVKDRLKIHFDAKYIYKSENRENLDLTMKYHTENKFIQDYLTKNGLSIIIYKINFEIISFYSDDEIIDLLYSSPSYNKDDLQKQKKNNQSIGCLSSLFERKLLTEKPNNEEICEYYSNNQIKETFSFIETCNEDKNEDKK